MSDAGGLSKRLGFELVWSQLSGLDGQRRGSSQWDMVTTMQYRDLQRTQNNGSKMIAWRWKDAFLNMLAGNRRFGLQVLSWGVASLPPNMSMCLQAAQATSLHSAGECEGLWDVHCQVVMTHPEFFWSPGSYRNRFILFQKAETGNY